MSMTEAASQTRRTIEAAASEVPAKAAAARAALVDLGEKTKDLAASLQTRAREEMTRRRSATADRLESIAGALRSEGEAPTAPRRAFAVAAGPAVALAVVLGAGVAVGLVVSRQMKRKREQRAAEALAETAKVETPPAAPTIEPQVPAGAGLSH